MSKEDNRISLMQLPPQGDSCVLDIVDGAKQWLDLVAKYGQDNERLRHLVETLNIEMKAKELQIKELEGQVAQLESKVLRLQAERAVDNSRATTETIVPGALASVQNEVFRLMQSSETSRPDRRRREPDWDYFKKLTSSSNAMSELNNRKAICYLFMLHKEDIIDELFHLKKKYSGNVACHLAMRLRSDVSTETKWSIFEKLFGRKNLRTYANRTMTPRDRNICKHLDDIMNEADAMELQN